MMHRKNRGFTLVELTIALTIIGLLLGGVMKGNEMLDNSRRGRVVEDLQSMRAAVQTFQDKYNAIPGDMTNASSALPGCPPGPNSLCDASATSGPAGGAGPWTCKGTGGDGVVGFSNWGGESSGGFPNAWICSYAQENRRIGAAVFFASATPWTRVENETVLFWAHLAMANLFSGVTTEAVTDPSAVVEWGRTLPSTPYGGGYLVRNGAGIGILPGISGWNWTVANPTQGIAAPAGLQIVLAIVPNITGQLNLFGPSQPGDMARPSMQLLNAKRAQTLDIKLDDGYPLGGKVLAYGDANTCFGQSSGVWPPEYTPNAAGSVAIFGKGGGGGGATSAPNCGLSVQIQQ